ncbi:AI-2E family transporter [Salinarchaeum laminariae]|uniref:AI-2E family transporter n=1 Tax=Salinarchaeum laminariae TaxID=869888 RepID=UPI0020C00E6E|nr:AI-2E family transporter [Salinarchaeum laminariae]
MNREQAFLLVLLVLTALASFYVLLPFLSYVLGALLLGYALRPVHCRLAPHLGERPAAITVIAGAALAIVLPLAYIGYVVYRDAQQLADGETDLDLATVETELESLTGQEIELAGAVGDAGAVFGEYLYGNAPEIVSYVTTVLLGLTVILFLVYYVLIDGPDFVQWAVSTAPLDDAVAHEIVGRMDRMTWGVVAGHIFVAFVQGIVGGIGLWIAGIPSATFWTTVMVITALLPVIGAFLVWGPAAGYLMLVGEPQMAAFLVIWGLLPVSLVDNYLRSIAIDQSADVNPGVILVGVVGGIYTLGAVGLFVGPIVIGMLAAMIRAFDRHYDALGTDTPPPDPPSDGRLSWLETEPAANKDDYGGHAPPEEDGDG